MLWRTFCGRFKYLILVSGSPKNRFYILAFFFCQSYCWERWKAKERGRQSRIWLDSITYSILGHGLEQTLGVSAGQGSWCTAVHGAAKSQTQLGD